MSATDTPKVRPWIVVATLGTFLMIGAAASLPNEEKMFGILLGAALAIVGILMNQRAK